MKKVRKAKVRLTREQVIEQFENIHGDKYDYSKFIWIKNNYYIGIKYYFIVNYVIILYSV